MSSEEAMNVEDKLNMETKNKRYEPALVSPIFLYHVLITVKK